MFNVYTSELLDLIKDNLEKSLTSKRMSLIVKKKRKREKLCKS